MKIAVDFDGTIVEHAYPEIGISIPGALDWLKIWQAAGAGLILWTMRSDGILSGKDTRQYLREAIEYCHRRGLAFDACNHGIGDREWTTSPKAYAHLYIDDAAFGCPLIPGITGDRPIVNWGIVGPEVLARIKAFNP